MDNDFECACCYSKKAEYMDYWYGSDGKTFCGQDCMFEYEAWHDRKSLETPTGDPE